MWLVKCMTAVGQVAARLAVADLKKFIEDRKIKIQAKVDFTRLSEMMVCADDYALKRNGWIVNCSLETVQFYVYRSNDVLRWIPAHKV